MCVHIRPWTRWQLQKIDGICIACFCSYYYAHSKTATGPVWDGKEEPRLLAVEARPAPAASRVSK